MSVRIRPRPSPSPVRRHGRALVAAATALTLAGAVSTTALAAPAGWQTNTSTKTQARHPSPTPKLVDIRTGEHQNFDRVVFDFSGAPPGYSVGYVRQVRADPSDKLVRLNGNANIVARLKPATAHREDGSFTYTGPERFSPGFANLREVALVGDYEGVVSVALGLRHKAGFRVFTLRDPTRIVVDVAH